MSHSRMPGIQRTAILASRLYIISFILIMATLSIFNSITLITIVQVKSSPTLDDFYNLYIKYPKTLSCPCKNPIVSTNDFVSVTPVYHQVSIFRPHINRCHQHVCVNLGLLEWFSYDEMDRGVVWLWTNGWWILSSWSTITQQIFSNHRSAVWSGTESHEYSLISWLRLQIHCKKSLTSRFVQTRNKCIDSKLSSLCARWFHENDTDKRILH